MPNNGVVASYNAVLNSTTPGDTMTLDGAVDHPTSITVNQLDDQNGGLVVKNGASLTVTTSTTVGTQLNNDFLSADGGTITLQGTLTNLSGGVLNQGDYQAHNGGTLVLPGDRHLHDRQHQHLFGHWDWIEDSRRVSRQRTGWIPTATVATFSCRTAPAWPLPQVAGHSRITAAF